MPTLRIALCQTNPVMGDINHNLKEILEAVEQATQAGCDIAVFGELNICGYPPEDLLYKQGFINDMQAALKQIAAASKDCVLIVGYAENDPAHQGLAYNKAALCLNGQIVGTYTKQELPNYNVFDEKRYFQSASEHPLWSIAGVTVGVAICEDLWTDNSPTITMANAGAQMLITLNASPYHQNKLKARNEMVAKRATQTRTPIAYVNLVGGQDELVFDGASTVVGLDGETLASAAQFKQQTLIGDFQASQAKPLLLPVTFVSPATPDRIEIAPSIEPSLQPLEELWQALGLGLKDYVHKNGFKRACLGLSGGIDSALTACIAADALGPENLHGVMMPSRYSSQHSITDSQQLIKNLGISGECIPIEPAHTGLVETLTPALGDGPWGLAEENLQSRIRGVILMAISNKLGGLVLTTGNKSETAVGYSTLYGDTAGAYAVIKDLWKLQVYELARYCNLRAGREIIPLNIIEKPPSAELRPDQRDDQSLPPYELLDPILIELIEHDKTADDLVAAGFDETTVRHIARLVDIAEYKRRQSPLGTKVSQRTFGRDRRMPITNRYRGGARLNNS